MRQNVAEFIGTFGLVFFGTGAVISGQQTDGHITNLGIAITFGLVVMAMVYTLGNISGAHLNPAVTIAFTIAGRFPVNRILPYILSQLSGGVLASLTLKFLFPLNKLIGTTLPKGSTVQSFILELILTFFLMFVIINVAVGSKEQGMFAGLAIGSVITLEAMFAGLISGASMNPDRSISPAIVSGHTDHLLYVFAPIIGAVTSIPVWKFLITTKSN